MLEAGIHVSWTTREAEWEGDVDSGDAGWEGVAGGDGDTQVTQRQRDGHCVGEETFYWKATIGVQHVQPPSHGMGWVSAVSQCFDVFQTGFIARGGHIVDRGDPTKLITHLPFMGIGGAIGIGVGGGVGGGVGVGPRRPTHGQNRMRAPHFAEHLWW